MQLSIDNESGCIVLHAITSRDAVLLDRLPDRVTLVRGPIEEEGGYPFFEYTGGYTDGTDRHGSILESADADQDDVGREEILDSDPEEGPDGGISDATN